MNIDDYIIASSSEMNTFILNLPPIKEAYKLNAVSFELMKFYPGDSSSVKVDYYSNKHNTLGFIISNDFLLNNPEKKIISDVLLIQNLIDNAYVVFIYESSFSFALIKEGEVIDFIQDCSLSDFEKSIINNEVNDKFFVNFSSSNNDTALFYALENNNFSKFDFNGKVSKKVLKNSTVFSDKKSRKNKSLMYSILGVILIFLLAFDFYEYKLSKNYLEQSSSMKKQYSDLSKRLNNISNTNNMDALHSENISYSSKIPSWYVFSILKGYKSYLKISNISLDNDTFRIDGVCNDALSLVSYINSSEKVKEVLLNQVQNTEEGLQKFVLTGKYDYE